MNAKLRFRSLALALTLLFAGSAFAQVQVSGTVTDADTGDALPGANVVIEGTTLGTATDQDGRYTISGVPTGTHTLTASFIGYEEVSKVITVNSAKLDIDFSLPFASQALEALEVFASRAVDRKTPVAFTNVDKVQVQRELGSRDAPLVLNTTPSVYATAQGGGAGDARVNVRGFNQRNVAIMLNGVPVNDMENGWVFWSNWDGVGDATTSIQLQRGLSAVNLATPSIGGTMNIITDPAANSRQVLAKQEVGNDGFLKSTVSVSTGLIDGKYAFTVSGVRKTGDGYYDGTWTDAWAYYAAGAWNINDKQRLDFYAVGAPQRHGQNLYKQSLAAYDHEYAREVMEDDGLSEVDIQGALNKFPEMGRRWNQTASPVSSSYGNNANNGFGSVDRPRDNILNERENFFHKPQVNLNYYYQISDKSLWSTVAYYSGGKGGGTGTRGSMVWDYSGPGRRVDYDATIARNETNGLSRGILRNSHNVQDTWGAISKFKHELNESVTLEGGLDWRTAEIEHYYSVRDLLGGSGYQSFANDFWGASGQVVGLGDKLNYYNTNTVDWLGAFIQGEYSKDELTAYGMAGYSTVKYGYKDHFKDDGGKPFEAESDNIGGYQVKGGVSYQVNDLVSFYGNAGYVSKVPIFDGAIDDVTGVLNPDPQNETFVAIEAGATFRSMDRKLAGKVNVYNTQWNDRTVTRFVQELNGEDGLLNIGGLNALHRGAEAEVAYQPHSLVRADVAVSLGDWYYTDDVSAKYTPDISDPSTQQSVDLYLKDIKVGDAPQTQFAYALTFFPLDGVYAKVTGRSYSRFFADFDPTSRTDNTDRGQSWEVPAYNIFDINLGYDIPREMLGASRFDIRVFGNIFNVFDSMYIQDAVDNSRYNAYSANGVNHGPDDAEVYLGLPRSFNFGTRITFK
ncbi:MAG: TonB-dependent receptor [Bacteroidetes Order II. Incertae sedis bacterium]|nr:TonB-dependent receptor [Bacteroidetes Order II. bacterium]MBT7400754.1 TonB-dependent receptor [Bacteroidetes Order II. bacterium]